MQKCEDGAVKQVDAFQAPSQHLNLGSGPIGLSTTTSSTDEGSRLIAELTGVTNVMIPVSTLEFLFQRFNMIERQLEQLKSLESRSFSSPGSSAVLAGTATADSEKLASNISALEEKIEKQSSLLNDIDCKCKLLLNNNVNLKTSNDAQHAGKNFSSASHGTSLNNSRTAPKNCAVIKNTSPFPNSITNRIQNSIQTRDTLHEDNLLLHPRNHHSSLGKTSSGEDLAEAEVIVTNIFEGSDVQRVDVAHAILATVVPSLERNDILSVRPLRPERQVASSDPSNVPMRRSSPWVVSLSRRELLNEIMRAKNKITAFSTKHVNVTLLNEETSNSLTQRKIFINELLNKNSFLEFQSLKEIARGLGFKYIWHRGGRFLVKRRDGELSHTFNTASDLHAIIASYGNVGITYTVKDKGCMDKTTIRTDIHKKKE